MNDYHNDWQSGRSVTECNKYMLQHEIGCDVTFRVGVAGDEVRAHKYVLASRSSVFFAMLYGPFQHGDAGTSIEIPDIEKDVFMCLLR